MEMTDEEYLTYTKIIGSIIYRRYRWFVTKFPDLKGDMMQTGLYTILSCKRTFNPGKGVKFETYIYRPISNALLIFVCDWLGYEGSKGNRRPRFENESLEGLFDAMVGYDMDGGANDSTRNKYLESIDENFDLVEINQILDELSSDAEREVLRLVAQGYKQCEIARMWKCSNQNINQIVKSIKNKFYASLR